VDHEPCGGIRALNVRPSASTFAFAVEVIVVVRRYVSRSYTNSRAPPADARAVRALLLQRVLDLEEVGKVAARLDAGGERDRLRVVVEDRELFQEPLPHSSAPDDRELRVDVDRACAWHEEEPRLEVLEVVGRQRGQPLSVDREYPFRQETRVEREQPGRVGERRLYVTAARR
jgi:hypothetical protein